MVYLELEHNYIQKLKEVAELKKDRDEKLRLRNKVEEIERQLGSKIDEGLTMSKRYHTLEIERDHFAKKNQRFGNWTTLLRTGTYSKFIH